MADRVPTITVLAAIDALTERNHGRSPSIRELGAEIGIPSATAFYRVQTLRRHGLLEPLRPEDARRYGTIRISPAGMLALTDAKACAA